MYMTGNKNTDSHMTGNIKQHGGVNRFSSKSPEQKRHRL